MIKITGRLDWVICVYLYLLLFYDYSTNWGVMVKALMDIKKTDI